MRSFKQRYLDILIQSKIRNKVLQKSLGPLTQHYLPDKLTINF